MPPEPPKEARKSEPREYTVLQRRAASSPGSPEAWEVYTKVVASSKEEAIRKAFATGGAEGTVSLVAVTSRSFKPVTVTVETKTQLVLS